MDIKLPTWPAKFMVPLALSVLWLRLVLQICGYVRMIRHPDAEPVARAQADHHRDAGEGRDCRGAGPRGRTMIELGPMTIGCLGVAALLVALLRSASASPSPARWSARPA